METATIKRKFDGVDYDIELTPDELERAFRIRERDYFREDARNHLVPYIETGDILEQSVSDETIDKLVDLFCDAQDFNIPENNTWNQVIEEYFESQRELIYHAYQSLLQYDKNSFIINSTKAGLVDIINLFGADVFDGKLKLALEALDNEDVDEAIGFLGEILE